MNLHWQQASYCKISGIFSGEFNSRHNDYITKKVGILTRWLTAGILGPYRNWNDVAKFILYNGLFRMTAPCIFDQPHYEYTASVCWPHQFSIEIAKTINATWTHIPTLQSSIVLPYYLYCGEHHDTAIFNMRYIENFLNKFFWKHGIIYDEEETYAQCPGDCTARIYEVILTERLGHENPSMLVWHFILCIG